MGPTVLNASAVPGAGGGLRSPASWWSPGFTHIYKPARLNSGVTLRWGVQTLGSKREVFGLRRCSDHRLLIALQVARGELKPECGWEPLWVATGHWAPSPVTGQAHHRSPLFTLAPGAAVIKSYFTEEDAGPERRRVGHPQSSHQSSFILSPDPSQGPSPLSVLERVHISAQTQWGCLVETKNQTQMSRLSRGPMGARAGAATCPTAWPAEPPTSCPHCLGQASVPRDSRKQVADSGKL